MAYSVPAPRLIKKGVILLDLAGSSATAVHQTGYTVETSDGKEFKFVYYQCGGDAVAAISGAPAVWVNTTADNVVTSDTSAADAEGGGCAGVFASDQANGDDIYLWIQTKGPADDCHLGSGVSAGDLLYVGQADVFEAVEDTFGSDHDIVIFGVAVAMENVSSTKGDIVLL